MNKIIMLSFTLAISNLANSADYKCTVGGRAIYQDKPCLNGQGASKGDNFKKKDDFIFFNTTNLHTHRAADNAWDATILPTTPIIAKCTKSYSKCWDENNIEYSLKENKQYLKNNINGKSLICNFTNGRMWCG